MKVRYKIVTLTQAQAVMFDLYMEERLRVVASEGEHGWEYVMHTNEHRNKGMQRVVCVLFKQHVEA